MYDYMKLTHFSISLICLFLCGMLNAQTTYKGVTLDRDKSDVKKFTLYNTNDYPVHVRVRYKIGSKESNWIDYDNGNDDIEVPARGEAVRCVGSKIYGLKLYFVDILQPSVGERIITGLGAIGKGVIQYEQSKAAQGTEQNTNQ